MFKKMLCGMLGLLLLACSAVGCGRAEEEAELRIVCTVFPIYDWVRNIVGDTEGVEVIWLCDNGADPHSYQPSAKNMVDLAKADLTVYVGGTSDAWVEEALHNQASDSGLALLSAEGVTSRCMSAESGHDHGDGHDHATDEHIWLSLKNAMAAVEAVTERLCALDGERAEEYRANAAAYRDSLALLDARYEKATDSAETPRVVCADRFPFVYLMEDYGIEYAAAFSGCTTDVDADFSVVLRLAQQLDAWDLKYILITEGSDLGLAESMKSMTAKKDQTVVAMDSLQSVSRKRSEEGITYLSVMEGNYSVLCRILEDKE